MPRGENPNSRKNLIANTERTPKQIRDRNSKAGKASAQIRKNYASLTECLKENLSPEDMDVIVAVLIRRAKQGNLKAYELIRDQLGEKPTEKFEAFIYEPNEEVMSRLNRAIAERRCASQIHINANQK